MGLIKHGEGSIVPAEDVQKTAAAHDEESRQERLAALQQENSEVDE